MDDFLGLVALLILGLVLGFFLCIKTYVNPLLNKCAKGNNVYECELTAIPKVQP